MGNLWESLAGVELPAFCVVRNLEDIVEDGFLCPGACAVDLNGECFGSAPTFEEAVGLLPKATLIHRPSDWPTDDPEVRYVYDRKGNIVWIEEDLDERDFNHDPLGMFGVEKYNRDHFLFGECYTILWVCPPDKWKIVARLTELALASGDSVSGFALFELWTQCFDRIAFTELPEDIEKEEPDDPDFLGPYDQLRKDVMALFEEEMRTHPKGPDDGDWELLDELLLK